MGKIVLFYVFTPLADPEAVRLWQRTLCESLGLRGRILISPHGINVTVGGQLRAVKAYVRGTRAYPGFRGADVKFSTGSAEDFPKLVVKVREEIVTFGAPQELAVDENGVIGGGERLSPEGAHALLARRPDAVFFDGRNRIEAQIGRFAGAVVPPVDTTREFVELLDAGEYDHLKRAPVITYCTGGVRCEVLTVLMRNRGFEQVYQLDGGIARYGEKYGDRGLWEGSMYVFDRRMKVDFSDTPTVVGRCTVCGEPTPRVANHPDPRGRELVVICERCAA